MNRNVGIRQAGNKKLMLRCVFRVVLPLPFGRQLIDAIDTTTKFIALTFVFEALTILFLAS